MFTVQAPKSGLASIGPMLRVTYHYTANKILGKQGSLGGAIVSELIRIAIMLGFFYLIAHLLGTRSQIRGNYTLFLLTGIFLYMLFNRSVGAVAGAEGHGSAAMVHPAMNTFVAIISSAISVLYLQTLTIGIIMLLYWAVVGDLEIEDPVGLAGMMLMAWANGCAFGMLFRALKPWMPRLIGVLSKVFMRANMFFSGKMFVANTMPFWLHPLFAWNPLFHIIDQARGYAFLNYSPQTTSMTIPAWTFFATLMVGLMGDFYALKYSSRGWWTSK